MWNLASCVLSVVTVDPASYAVLHVGDTGVFMREEWQFKRIAPLHILISEHEVGTLDEIGLSVLTSMTPAIAESIAGVTPGTMAELPERPLSSSYWSMGRW